jgi:curved DNA-binding protein CbpA
MTAALRNVNDLNEVYKSFRATTKETKSESSSKKKDLEEKKKKKRAKKKEKKEKKKLKKKEKKEKKKAKKSKRSSSSSSSSSDDDDDDENDSESTHSESDDDVEVSRKTLLERGSNAIEAVLHILARFPNQRQDLRVLLKNVDDGNAVPIDGLPDEIMKRLLEIVFKNVGMVKLPSTGAWTLTKKRLTRKEFAFAKVALAFEAEEERLRTLRTCMLPWESEEFARKRMEKKKEEMMRETMERNCGREEAEVLTGEEAAARLKEHGQEIDEDTDDDTEKDKGEKQSVKKQGTLKFKEQGTDNDTVGVAPAAAAIEGERPKKQLGPMAPPKEMLEEMQRQQRELADEGFGFGPPPPDIVEFLDSKSSESRAATARRVISILKNDGDAYDVLSASPEHSNAELKKVYWKLSLVIHPDKCDDPCAAAAFDAVKKAYEMLKDETQRKVLDEKRKSAKDREEFQAWLKNEREKAIWRKKRNESLPGDEDLLNDAFDKAPGSADDDKPREEWMTELPPERKAAQGPLSASVTAFAKDGLMVRDQKTIDEWTRNPKEGKSETMLFLEQQEKMYALPNAAAQAKKEDEKRKMIDEYNEGAGRTKSLLEQHRENLGNNKNKKKTKKKKVEESSGSDESNDEDEDDRKLNRKKQRKKKARKDEDDDGTGWTYRPFDREKDLRISKVGEMDPREAMKRAGGGLSTRFGGGGIQ